MKKYGRLISSDSLERDYLITRRIIKFASVVLLMTACYLFILKHDGSLQYAKTRGLEKDDYLVYSALIKATSRIVTGVPILIVMSIDAPPIFTEPGIENDFLRWFPSVLVDTAQDFVSMNQSNERQLLDRKFNLFYPYVLIEDPPRDYIGNKKRVGELRRQYKGARNILQFSRIGFNKKRNQAILLLSVINEEGGSLQSIYLQKIGRIWHVKGQKTILTI